jgi:hypothetical protein
MHKNIYGKVNSSFIFITKSFGEKPSPTLLRYYNGRIENGSSIIISVVASVFVAAVTILDTRLTDGGKVVIPTHWCSLNL